MSENSSGEPKTICVIGASRGLGRAVAIEALKRGFERFILISRNQDQLDQLKNEIIKAEQTNIKHIRSEHTTSEPIGSESSRIEQQTNLLVQTTVIDFSKDSALKDFAECIGSTAIHTLIYCAGGGGHGRFGKLSWDSHRWTFKVNLLAPAELIHWAMNHTSVAPQHVVVVGSALADQAPEPLGASYAAAKAGLRALLESLAVDERGQDLKVHLFRPGFLDTSMIPKGSWPRRIEGLVESPAAAARRVLDLVSGTPFGG